MKRPVEGVKTLVALRKRRPDRFSRLLICNEVIKAIEEHIRETGRHLCEEAAFLAGYVTFGSVGVVTTAILPYTYSSAGSCTLPLDVTAGCFKATKETGQVILAQVHSHPGRSWHSTIDDDWAVCDCPGFFSIVVPCYGRFGLNRLFAGGAAIYELTDGREWRRLPLKEIRSRFQLIPSSYAVV